VHKTDRSFLLYNIKELFSSQNFAILHFIYSLKKLLQKTLEIARTFHQKIFTASTTENVTYELTDQNQKMLD